MLRSIAVATRELVRLPSRGRRLSDASQDEGGKTLRFAYETCSSTSTSHSGASTITSWPAAVVSNVVQVLSALHSA